MNDVWSGFRHPSTPEHAAETILWRVTKGTSGRSADAPRSHHAPDARIADHREWRTSVVAVFGRREGINEVGTLSNEFRIDLERVGWTRDRTR
jgi:hypothetical protein